MANSELSLAVQTLKHLHIENLDESNCIELCKLFDSALKLRDLIDESNLSSNDKDLQEAISVCIKALEKCTLMVNELELFSSNETYVELQTSSIRYLLLPALLGCLNIAVQTRELAERMKYIEFAEVYYKDFLFRCKNYELCASSLRDFDIMHDDYNEKENSADIVSRRDKKIQQYKQKKELEDRLKALKPALERSEEEEYIREYYFVLLEKWILTALEELENLKNEKAILKCVPPREEVSKNSSKERKSEIKPLKPIIITKNEIQKQVFGLGYPSFPVMTIDDFYRQRFEKTVEENKSKRAGMSLQDTALSGQDHSKESEEMGKEELVEKDDPDALIKARQWDDWKDDNQRGSGNRYNKG